MKRNINRQISRIWSIIETIIRRPARMRRRLAYRYVSGHGIEIGALHNPLIVPPHAHITYVDRMTVDELRKQYPELSDKPLVDVQIVDDGERLASIHDANMDFVIANHMIEHCENPLLALRNWLRVLRKEGILYLAVPNKMKTFDIDRPLTPLEHIIRDYENGPAGSRRGHFEECVVRIHKTEPAKVAAEVARLTAMNYSIHYHVWDPPAFLELLEYCREKLAYPLHLETSVITGNEVIVILRKAA